MKPRIIGSYSIRIMFSAAGVPRARHDTNYGVEQNPSGLSSLLIRMIQCFYYQLSIRPI